MVCFIFLAISQSSWIWLDLACLITKYAGVIVPITPAYLLTITDFHSPRQLFRISVNVFYFLPYFLSHMQLEMTNLIFTCNWLLCNKGLEINIEKNLSTSETFYAVSVFIISAEFLHNYGNIGILTM